MARQEGKRRVKLIGHDYQSLLSEKNEYRTSLLVLRHDMEKKWLIRTGP
jgi:hypothetical protein